MSALTVSMRDVERDVELDLDIPGGSTLALLGPNGAGKSTLLAAVAGTRQVPGSLRLGGRDLHQLPPHRRRIPLLSQDPLLLPHLSVLDNVAFGPRASGASRRTARAQAQEWLERADVAQLAQRRATDLSGGQAQRVAIARALATRPEAILLDEPLAALDVDARPAVRHLLGEILADITTILVTHDIVDAVLLADDTAVLVDGRVVEHRPVGDVTPPPVDHRGVARLGSRVRPGWFAQTQDHPGLVGRTLLEILHRGDDHRERAAASAGAEPGVEAALSVAVTPGRAVAGSLVSAGADHAVDIGLHDQLQHALGNAAQEIAVSGLRHQLGKR